MKNMKSVRALLALLVVFTLCLSLLPAAWALKDIEDPYYGAGGTVYSGEVLNSNYGTSP